MMRDERGYILKKSLAYYFHSKGSKRFIIYLYADIFICLDMQEMSNFLKQTLIIYNNLFKILYLLHKHKD